MGSEVHGKGDTQLVDDIPKWAQVYNQNGDIIY